MFSGFPEIEITKTSSRARWEKEDKEQFMKRSRVCPECGTLNEDLVMSSLGTRTVKSGLFKETTVNYSEYHFVCKNCGCEWVARRDK